MKVFRFALLSHVLPPSPSGQAVMLYRILAGVDAEQYYLIDSGQATSSDLQTAEDRFRLLSKYYSLSSEQVSSHTNLFGISHVLSILTFFVQVIARSRNILEVLQREPYTSSIIACSGDLVNIPASFLASRFARISFYAYIFDDYVFQWTGSSRWIARLITPFIVKHSDGVIGPNEFILEEYKQRYGIKLTLVRNPCDANELGKEPYSPWPDQKDKIKIIYTGAIYHANYDCFRNLLHAMDVLSEYPLELHIFTAQTSKQLQEQGIAGEKIIVQSHTPYDEILKQQRKADILFLPLAFESPIPEVIRTSSPGKLGEYLASGRPVLAHAPADSFVANYCSKHECAGIAKQNDAVSLAQHLKHLITNKKFRARIISNALSQSQADFSPQHAREKLIQFLNA